MATTQTQTQIEETATATPAPKLYSTTIPFDGFYESSHDAELDFALEQLTQDDSGDQYSYTITDDDGEEQEITPGAELWQHVVWPHAYDAYAKMYAQNFGELFEDYTKVKLDLTFDELVSPREYNFTTDRIFVKVPESAVLALWAKVNKRQLNKLIHEKFTSYDGFASYYPNSLAAWPRDPLTWDHNQLGTLLEAVLSAALGESHTRWDRFRDDLTEDSYEQLDEIVYDALDAEGRAIVEDVSKRREAEEWVRTHQGTLPFAEGGTR